MEGVFISQDIRQSSSKIELSSYINYSPKSMSDLSDNGIKSKERHKSILRYLNCIFRSAQFKKQLSMIECLIISLLDWNNMLTSDHLKHPPNTNY